MNIAVDIDDCVADLVPCIIDRFNKKNNTSFVVDDITSYDLAKHINISKEDFIKELYAMMLRPNVYSMTAFEELDTIKYAKEVINSLYSLNHNVYFVSNRVDATSTTYWLDSVGFSYDACFLGKDKWAIIKNLNIEIYIDDRPEFVLEMADKGVPIVIVFDRPWNREVQETLTIRRFKNWKEILKFILQLKNGFQHD